jgi:hypothetical protein
MGQVKADTRSVELAPGGSAEVTFANAAPGPMTLSLGSLPPGIEAKLAHPNLDANGKTTLTLKAGDHAKSGTLSLTVIQTREVIPIRVTIH